MRQHSRLLVLTLLVGLVLGMATWWTLRRYAPSYRTEARLIVSSGLSDPYETPTETGGLSDQRLEVYAAIIANQIELITSDEVLNRVLQNSEVRRTQWFQNVDRSGFSLDRLPLFGRAPHEVVDEEAQRVIRARRALREALGASPVRGSTLISVNLRGQYPRDLRLILDQIVNVYLDTNQRQSETQQFGVRTAMNRELDEAERELQAQQQALQTFVREHDIPNLTVRGTEETISYESLAVEAARAQLDLSRAHAVLEAAEEAMRSGRVAASPDELAMVEADPAILTRDERLRQLREQRDIYLDRFGERHRHVREIDMQMLAVEQERQREIERLLRERQAVRLDQARRMLAGSEANALSLEAKLQVAGRRVRDISAMQAQYQQRVRAVDTATTRRDRARAMLDDLRIRRSRPDNVPVRVLLEANEPQLVFPILPQIVLLVAFGLTAAMTGLIFLRELIDQRIKAPHDMHLLPVTALVGVVPAATEDRNAKGDLGGITRRHPQGLIAEAMRTIRTNLLKACDAKGHKTILFVGAHAGTGVSTTICNLALSLAMHGSKVLVIDGDLRRPAQRQLFNLDADHGMVEVVRGQTTLADAVRTVETGLDVLVAGDVSDAPPEIVDQSGFRDLLAAAKQNYDVVLIDAPPALLTSEPLLMARVADATVVVVRAMRDHRGAIGRLLRQFDDQPAELLGTIINDLRANRGGYLRKNYQAYYKYHHSMARRVKASA